MTPSPSLDKGPTLIAAGLAIVLAALIWPGIPIASAIILIGYGATVTVFARSAQQDLLGLINLAVYASLAGLAIMAQTHAATDSMGIAHLVDHFVAAALLVVLIREAVRRLSPFST